MIRLFTYVVAGVIALSSGLHTATAANPKPEVRCSSNQPAKVELACGIRSFRSNKGAVRWIKNHRQLAVVRQHETPHSLRYYVWQMKVSRHWIRQAEARLHPRTSVSYAAPAGLPPHAALWNCIHNNEGPWNDTSAPYAGGLQMSIGWENMVSNAGYLSQAQQEWIAEKAFASNHYQVSFLVDQWFKWDGAYYCEKYAG